MDDLKVPKKRFLGFWQKPCQFRYAFLLQHEVLKFFLYLLEKQNVCKNLVLELWLKNLETNQNAGFFKPQYLTKNLRYEVEFLDMIKGPRKH